MSLNIFTFLYCVGYMYMCMYVHVHVCTAVNNNRMCISPLQVSYVRNTQKEQDEELNRLTQEVTMLGRLNHPNVVRCLGATQHDGHINVFVEWMAGG